MSRYSDYKHANEILRSIEKNPEKYLIIHYSCESFFNLNGKSPRIASVSVRQYGNAQTNNFSIHQYAEILQIEISEISDDEYRKVEKALFDDFYEFVKTKTDKVWLHWNMRDTSFGFNALELRYKVLGGTPFIIDNDKKVDINHLFKQYYGSGYAGDPRIKVLGEKNKFIPKQFLDGGQEARAFDEHRFVDLSLSTSSKVNMFSSFIKAAIDDSLKTDIPKLKRRGTNVIGFCATIYSTLWGKFLFWLVNTIIAGIIGALIGKFI